MPCSDRYYDELWERRQAEEERLQRLHESELSDEDEARLRRYYEEDDIDVSFI